MNLKIKIKNRSFLIKEVKPAKGFEIFRGLMFSNREKSHALLFNIKSSLHSLFVFLPFIVLWLDDKNKVLEWKLVKSWKLYINSNSDYSKILEIPINRRYKSSL